MANKKGTALLIVSADIPADKEADFNAWYNEEHLPELLGFPGFLNAARYEAVKSGPKHLACYELESAAALESDAFKNRSKTDWGKRVSPSNIGSNYIQNVYEMIRPAAPTPEIAQADMAPVLQIGRMAIPPEHEDEWNQWYNNIYTTNYEKVPGCIRARRWKAVRGEPQYAVVYELEHEKVSESAEWLKQRDIDPSNEGMRSLMQHAPGSPGIWKKTFQL
jgi:antibiotic biosynthesis monooxygenase (ABM) superfamily enzyme